MTPFRFEHDFKTASIAQVFRAYFDPALAAEHDRLSKVARREELERHDSAERLVVLSKVVPERQFPVFLKPFVSGDLHYTERVVWERGQDRLDIDIRPSLMGKRTRIRISYLVSQPRPGVVHRVYEGDVTVEIALIGGRAERFIIDDIGETLGRTSACTQEWLDAHP